ncbi:MAG: hypothetical protein NTW08_06275 [Gammaproteobacteria bacterium]|nr:hypothetical protein [Gammaproteobacteria bacterium]
MPHSNFEAQLTELLRAHRAYTDTPLLSVASTNQQFMEQCDHALTEGTNLLRYIVKTAKKIEELQQPTPALVKETQRIRAQIHALDGIAPISAGMWHEYSEAIEAERAVPYQIRSLSITYQDARARFEKARPFYQKLVTFTQIVGFNLPLSQCFHDAYVAALTHLDPVDQPPPPSKALATTAFKHAFFSDGTEHAIRVAAAPQVCLPQDKAQAMANTTATSSWTQSFCKFLSKLNTGVQAATPSSEPTSRALM